VSPIRDVITAEEVAAARAGQPLPKGKSRLEATIDERPLTVVDEKQFKKEVWHRDQHRCRWCERKAIKTIARVPERGEIHHIHGRGKDLRFEVKAACLLCAECHEKVTGRVNEKWIIVPSKTFRMRDETYTDARFPITFRRIV
jgi:hypothetical protein